MGPLTGTKIIELSGIGPGPYAGMLLADLGAEVICIERPGAGPVRKTDISFRNKRSVLLDLKSPTGLGILRRLIDDADGLIEGFRPGVTERLGVGPEACLERNPRLVYGRITGWGRDGPLAETAGHDINYIALAGALFPMGRAGERPVPPLNLVADMGGGGMQLAFGMVCALFERERSGHGQVVDAAMIDGAASQLWLLMGMAAGGLWDTSRRGANMLDGGAHFYDTYQTADGKYLAVGAIEPQFFRELITTLGLDEELIASQHDPSRSQAVRDRLVEAFRSRTQAEWMQTFEGSEACVTPVLSVTDAPSHPHNRARGTFVEADGFDQPAPAPRFDRTPGEIRHGIRRPGEDTDAVLTELGFDAADVDKLREAGVVH